MSRLIFAALTSLAFAAPSAAQHVAGRDLLDFPIGLLAEAPPLSMQMAGGLWNPAATAIATNRGLVGVAGLTTPQDQGVRLEMVGGAFRVRSGLTATFSAATASVSDILRTDTDPTSIGSEVPYGTAIVSVGASQAFGNVTIGAAARYRTGTVDADHARELGLDGGAIVDRVGGTPVRIALSTFLFSPWRMSEVPTYMAAADMPVFRRDSSFTVRAGYSVSTTSHRADERYFFATSSYRQLDLSAGIARASAYGSSDSRLRLGCGFRYASYKIAIGREDGAAGFGGSFQFLLTRVIR